MPTTKRAADRKRSGRLKMLIVAALCAAPIVASYFAYYVWPPARRVNYGDLLEVRPLPAVTLKELDGRPFSLANLKGKWLMLSVDSGACAPPCQDKLLLMRQLRLMQGRDMERIERVWLITDEAPLTTLLIREYDGMRMLRVPGTMEGAAFLQSFSAPDSPNIHVYLADPYGNLMMRFPANPEPARMKKDLERLFKAQGSAD